MRHQPAFANWVSILIGLSSLAPAWARAEAPAFCDAKYFLDREIDLKKAVGSGTAKKLEEAHAFKLSGFTLVGLAVGLSDVDATRKLAKKLGGSGGEDKYCTWYLNQDYPKQIKTFNWRYFEYPIENVFNPSPEDDEKYTIPEIKKFYLEKFTDILDQADNSFTSCIENRNFLAFGCDGMAHRGPTVFAMLLAFAGCSPKMAVDLAVQLWGENEIVTDVRYQIAEQAAQLGRDKPALRARLQKLF